MKLSLTLNYDLSAGWLEPWVAGLRAGRAVGSVCGGCAEVRFPPLRFCPSCGERATGWKTLPGTASIAFRTTGTDGDFALVRFDGASNAAVARADTLPDDALTCALLAVPEGPPAILIGPKDTK